MPLSSNSRWMVLFLLAALSALLAALWAGLIRLGWAWPPLQVAWLLYHGPLMLGGFFGTLVSLERAAALAALFKRRWSYAAPGLAALGGVTLLLGFPDVFGRSLLTLGSLGLVAIFIVIYRHHPNAAHGTMGLGAMAWLLGNGLWLAGQPIYRATPWWIGFLVLTIAGERLELTRVLLRRPLAQRTFYLGIGVLLTSLLLSVVWFPLGVRCSGVGLLCLSAWLLRFDLAGQAVRRQTGLPRFIAACLWPGYVWLGVAGALWIWQPEKFNAGVFYDAQLHAILVGFAFSMIFGHAPIIFPALTGRPITYHPRFYGPLIVLHLGLGLRVVGDLTAEFSVRQWGGLLNALAVLLFLGNLIYTLALAPVAPVAEK